MRSFFFILLPLSVPGMLLLPLMMMMKNNSALCSCFTLFCFFSISISVHPPINTYGWFFFECVPLSYFYSVSHKRQRRSKKKCFSDVLLTLHDCEEMNHFMYTRIYLFIFCVLFGWWLAVLVVVNVFFREFNVAHSLHSLLCNFTKNACSLSLYSLNAEQREANVKKHSTHTHTHREEFIWQQKHIQSTYHQNTHVTALHALLMMLRDLRAERDVFAACKYCICWAACFHIFLYTFIFLLLLCKWHLPQYNYTPHEYEGAILYIQYSLNLLSHVLPSVNIFILSLRFILFHFLCKSISAIFAIITGSSFLFFFLDSSHSENRFRWRINIFSCNVQNGERLKGQKKSGTGREKEKTHNGIFYCEISQSK